MRRGAIASFFSHVRRKVGRARRRGSSSCATCAASGVDCHRGPSSPAAPAVFAVFTGNYQRATSPSPQKSWSSGSPAEQGTARRSAVNRCKFAKGDLAGAEIAYEEPTVCCRLRITIFLEIACNSQFVKNKWHSADQCARSVRKSPLANGATRGHVGDGVVVVRRIPRFPTLHNDARDDDVAASATRRKRDSRHIFERRVSRTPAPTLQLCSRVSLKRIPGHSSIVVRKSQALRARNTGTPSWSSALAEGFLMWKRSSSAGSSASSQRAA